MIQNKKEEKKKEKNTNLVVWQNLNYWFHLIHRNIGGEKIYLNILTPKYYA